MAPRCGPAMRHPGVRLYGKDHRELGARAALLYGDRIKLTMRMLSRVARGRPWLIDPGKPAPGAERLAELEGLSRGLSMGVDELSAAGSVAQSLAMAACTNFGALPPVTGDGDAMLSWNFDAAPPIRAMFGRFPLFVREVDGTIPYLCMGFPAFFGIGVMNAEGLCCVVNAVGIRDDGDGLSSFEMNNRCMETCSTVDAAEEVFATGPRGAVKAMTMGMLMNWNTIWTDRSGDLSVFEYSHNHFHRHRATDDRMVASANHHQFLDRSLSGSFDPGLQELITGSYSRLARMYAMLAANADRIDPERAKAMVSDHFPDYSLLREFGMDREWWEEMPDDATVCAHAWNLRRHLAKGKLMDAGMETAMSTTLYSFQIRPAGKTVWFTCGHPCRNETVPLYWGDMLGADGRRPDGALLPDRPRSRVRRDRGMMFGSDGGVQGERLTRVWMSVTGAIEDQNFKHLAG